MLKSHTNKALKTSPKTTVTKKSQNKSLKTKKTTSRSITTMRKIKNKVQPNTSIVKNFSTSTEPQHVPRPRRSLLYIPGSSLKMLSKAPQCGADTVCFDVEDGVAFSSKEIARTQITSFLSDEMKKLTLFPKSMEICLRINAVSSGDIYQRDIEWLESLDFAPHSVALPKMDTVKDFQTFLPVLKKLEAKHNAKIQLIGMIESPMAVINLPAILNESMVNDNNHSHLTALIFGGDDYSSMSGCLRTATNHELDFPRAMVQMHASAHQIGCLDIVCKEFKDPTRFELESQKSMEQGYIGRQCIHPSQLQAANKIYAPSQDTFEWANGVVEEYNVQAKQGVGAFTYRSMMIDLPTIKRAENILTRGKLCGMEVGENNQVVMA